MVARSLALLPTRLLPLQPQPQAHAAFSWCTDTPHTVMVFSFRRWQPRWLRPVRAGWASAAAGAAAQSHTRQHPSYRRKGTYYSVCACSYEGFNSFRFDLSGSGESSGAFKLTAFDREVDDITAARRCMEEQHSQRVVALLGVRRENTPCTCVCNVQPTA
jgi:hypothetical protein